MQSRMILLAVLVFIPFYAGAENLQYLLKPTGKYHVSAKQYHLVNTYIFPDYFYQKSDEWYYSDKNHCHPVDVTLYYPTNSPGHNYRNYFTYNIQQVKLDIRNKVISDKNLRYAKQYITQQEAVKSYVLESGAIANGKFPLIIFLPAFSANSYYYQNYITNLVSHGYIVAAIDSAYSQSMYNEKTGRFLPVSPIKFESGLNSALQVHSNLEEVSSDYDFVLNKLQDSTSHDKLIRHIDFTQIGGLGHSLGARSIYNKATTKGTRLKAAVAMEIGRDKILLHNHGVNIPFLFINAAEMKITDKQYFGSVSSFELYKDNFMITMAPTESNTDYSRHMTFSDNATLYYHDNKLFKLSAQTYNDNSADYNQWLGNGNAYTITGDVNKYLLEFFDYYLKGRPFPILDSCNASDIIIH